MHNGSEMLHLCRLCLVKDKVNIPIFAEQDDLRQIFVKISSCLPVTVQREDQLPKNICDGCSYKLDLLYEFCNTSVNSEKQLLQWIRTQNPTASKAGTTSTKDNDIIKQEALDPSEPAVALDDKPDLNLFDVEPEMVEEPPFKKTKRAAAQKAAIATQIEVTPDSDDEDDDNFDADAIAKMEDESDDSDAEGEGEEDLEEPAYVEVPSANVEAQPGPSGLGKDGVEAPWAEFIDGSEAPKYQCGVCFEVFPTKSHFLKHHMNLYGQLFTCCRCDQSFINCTQLYQHYEIHKLETMLVDETTEGSVEEIVLNYQDEEEEVEQSVISDSNELMYILDDAQCVNEVVIEEDDPQLLSDSQKMKSEALRIVKLEHGYMMPSGSSVEEQNDEEDETIYDDHSVVIRKSIPFAKTNAYRKVSTPSKRRSTPLLKRRQVPDFSASNYIFIAANDEIEVAHFKCLRCEQLFINKFGFFRHIEKGKCYINHCDVCSASFSKNSEFFEHYVSEHSERAVCNFCFRTFMYEKNVKEHMLRHLDQFRHRCEDCNKGFYTVREYRNHYKNRHMGIRQKCNICSRSYADQYYFKRHLATHANNDTILQFSN